MTYRQTNPTLKPLKNLLDFPKTFDRIKGKTETHKVRQCFKMKLSYLKKAFDGAFFVLPFNSYWPIRVYLSLAYRVTILKDGPTIRKILLLQLFIIVDILKTAYLAVTLPANPLDRIRLVDAVFICIEQDRVYPIWILLQTMILYYNYILFFTVKPIFLRYLADMFFSENGSLFGENTANSRAQLKSCRRCSLWTVNSIGLLKLIASKYEYNLEHTSLLCKL